MDRSAPPDGDVNRNSILVGVSWTLATLAAICVSLRFYSRVLITRNPWWDDWAILATMMFSLTFTIMWVIYANNGGTRHVFYLQPQTQITALKINWISQTFCVLGLAFGKISVGFLIMRIGIPQKKMRILLYFFMTSQFVLFSLAIVFVYAQCRPVTKLWNFLETDGTCWDPQVLTVWTIICSSYSAFLDVALAVIPVSVIWSLQLPRHKKINLSLVLSVGVFAAICGAIKTSKLPSESARSDFTWNTVPLFIWNSVEINVVIIAACVPAIRPLFMSIFHPQTSSEYSSYGRSKKSYMMHASSDKARSLNARKTDLESNSTWKGTDGDGEGLVKPGDGITQTVDLDVMYEGAGRDGNDAKMPRQAEEGW